MKPAMETAPDIPIDLHRHCIETAVRRQYSRSVSEYFRAKNPSPALERRIELLKAVLERCDFPRLRAEHPELRGGSPAPVSLGIDSRKQLFIRVGKTVVHVG